MELDVTVLEGFEGCTLNLESNCGEDSPDIVFKDMKTTVEGVRAMCGRTKTPETKNGPKPMVCMAYTEVPEAVEFAIEDNGDANRLTFITSISTSLDDAARQEREDILQYTIGALNHGLQLAESKQLRELHIAEWAKLWTRGVTAQNHSDLNGAIKSSLYAILSSVRPDWPFGLAPGGLTNVFNGHSFWDTEIWMYPPLLMLYPDIAESLLLYRFQRLEGAKIKAKSYDPPYEGFMFPWESAFSGVETCPLWAASGIREQHISSDISHAVWQYWLMQRDEDWLRNVGLKILVGVAGI
jgi:trehalose/maltose hydrolase-like predicted phosphorylase